MLPEKGPWPHPYYDIDDSFVDVTFTDVEGTERRVNVRQKRTGDGSPMVLVHGLMTSSYSWRYVLAPLGRRHCVYAPDLVGAGASDKPLDMKYSVENVARFLVAYIQTVTKERVYLIGNSLGGLYALRALMIAGADSLATRFVLMHAPGYPILRLRLLRTLLGAPALGSGLSAIVARVSHRFPEEFIRRNVHYARKDMMSREECIEYGRQFETLDGSRVFARILSESLDPVEHVRIIEVLRQSPLGIPVRLLYATKDVMVPPAIGAKYHADMPGSDLVWMDDASHFIHVDAPERTVEQIVEFNR